MRLFGFDITRAKKSSDFTTSSQLRHSDGQGPYTNYFSSYIPRKVETTFYEILREAIPVIDAAIWKLVALDGHLIVKGNNGKLVDEIQEWMDNVLVNDLQKGLQAFHQGLSNETFEQGFGLGEFLPDKKRTDIIRLKVADSKTIKFSRTEKGIDIFQKADDDTDYRKLKPNNLLYWSNNNENQNPYGTSILRSMEFVGKVLATMHNSLLNVWERFGDPSYHISYKSSRRGIGGSTLDARRKQLHEDFETSIQKKREGKSIDFVTAIDKDSDIIIKVIGADGQVLEMEYPARHVLEQIIAKTGLPSWMLGMHWSTTERLADKEVTMLQEDRATRHAAKLPLFTNLVKTLLILRGRTWGKGDWQIEFEKLNLHDIEKEARARFLNLQGDYYVVQNAVAMGTEVDPAMLSTKKGSRFKVQGSRVKIQDSRPAPCGCHKTTIQPEWHKELRRPREWPELDKLEDEYEKELKYEWRELQNRVFTILKLEVATGLSLKIAAAKGPEDFTFSDEQRALILQALKELIGIFDINDPDSPITWYYGQAYSLGLIQAADMVGEAQPILNIIKNQEIVDKLRKDGFKLVKDRASINVEKILSEIDAQVIAGTNPVHVAERLKKLFGNANADWERLARSELAMSAETAKLDEWKEWKVKMVEFVPAPDACAFCFSLAGDYPIKEAPVPVADTHPRCRCSTRPAEKETT